MPRTPTKPTLEPRADLVGVAEWAAELAGVDGVEPNYRNGYDLHAGPYIIRIGSRVASLLVPIIVTIVEPDTLGEPWQVRLAADTPSMVVRAVIDAAIRWSVR